MSAENWRAVQSKTFIKWVNSKLSKQGISVSSLTEDFCDGVVLVKLLEAIGNTTIHKYSPNPKHEIQKIENVNRALEFIKGQKLSITNIGAEDIVKGNEKLILGLLWTIILRFSIAEISEGELTAREGLLLWCKKRTKEYDCVNVKDFTNSWKDGLAFCALIHKHRPDLIDFDNLKKENCKKNLETAFSIANKELDIPKLLDPEDLIDTVCPDERSIMTYVAYYFHCFSEATKVEIATRRVNNFLTSVQSIFSMEKEYEDRIDALVKELNEYSAQWKVTVDVKDRSNSSVSGMPEDHTKVKSLLKGLLTDYKDRKKSWASEKRSLEILFGNILSKLSVQGLKSYEPEPRHKVEVLEEAWVFLHEKEFIYRSSLTKKLREARVRYHDLLRDAFIDFQNRLNGISASLRKLEGSTKEQLELVETHIKSIEELERKIPVIQGYEKCYLELESRECNGYSVDELIHDFNLVKDSTGEKRRFLDLQASNDEHSGLSQQQRGEYESMFIHFDKNNSKTLSKIEFKAALAGLGTSLSDEQIDVVFCGKEEICFDQFVSFFTKLNEDNSSPGQLLGSFEILSSGESGIKESDLTKNLDKNTVEFITKNFKELKSSSNEKIYDFKVFVESTCRSE